MENSNSQESGWYYESNGNRLGPISVTEIATKLSEGSLSRSTLVWNEGWGNKQDWRPAQDTSLMESIQDSGPPPLPADNINKTLAWALVGVPIVGTLIEIILYQSVEGLSDKWYFTLIAYFLVNSALAIKDAGNIKKSGNQDNIGFWFWLVPIYLYKRARSLRQRLSYFWSWLVSFIVSIVVMGMAESSNTYWGLGTPPCSSPVVLNLAKDIFNDTPHARIQGTRALDLRDISEISSTGQSRLCRARLSTSNTLTYPVQYEVSLQGDNIYVTLEIRR